MDGGESGWGSGVVGDGGVGGETPPGLVEDGSGGGGNTAECGISGVLVCGDPTAAGCE